MTGHTTEFFLELESRIWQAQVHGDAAAERELLPPDFLGLTEHGFADLEDHLAELDAGPITETYALAEARLTVIADDAVLLSYRADFRRPEPADAEIAYISSLWVRRGERWWNTFSQDTPADQSSHHLA